MKGIGRLQAVLAILVGIFLLMPLIAVIPVSFTPKRFLSMPDGNWSLRHYEALVSDPVWLESFMMSVRVGLVAATLATLLGLLFALGIWMTRPRYAGFMIGVALLPMVAPPVVSALTLYFFLNRLGRLNSLVAYDTWLGVAMAHAVMVMPFAVVVIMVALTQVDRRIDMAARSMGAGLRDRIWHVILPNIRFGVGSAFFLCFVLSWEEIGVTLFITSVQAITLPRRMWMGLRDNIDPAIAAISVLLTALVFTIILLRTLFLLRRKR